MACQGCGRSSETRLCCPTCVEFGKTNFFCSQECFTKNWKLHNQLHENLRRKKVGNESVGGARASSVGPGGGAGAVPGLATAIAGAGAEGKGNSKAGSSAAESATVPGLVGWLWAGLRGAAGAKAGGAVGTQPRGFMTRGMMLIIVTVIMVVGGMHHVTTRLYAESSVLPELNRMWAPPPGALPSSDVAHDAIGAAGTDALANVLQELRSLRGLVETHDRKLRYILERYVENVDASASNTVDRPQSVEMSAAVRNASDAGMPSLADYAAADLTAEAAGRHVAGGRKRNQDNDIFFDGAGADAMVGLEEAGPQGEI
eukprot:NODE_12449_length_1224_cov_1.774840.p1 GENE.NODE_12449_length_1224_cov_1.774840~~NODE_12449_length_1224_cov_1.774840.p1  ORF type:complete len:336 (+),score=100.95 NODE_12449_length_1224_cov_1.774840:64-1008(+)